MQAYTDLVNHVLRHGVRKENRTGIDTLSTFNYNYELGWDPTVYHHSPIMGQQRYLLDRTYVEGSVGFYRQEDARVFDQCHNAAFPNGFPFPLLTTKNVSWKNIVVEMLWFLSGQKDISILKRHGCKFWDDWADEKGNVPSAYGNFWRHFPTHRAVPLTEDAADFNDQIAWVLAELRRNPMSRRMVVSAWAPGNAQTSKLPPCHAMFVLNVQNVGVRYMHYGHNEGRTPICTSVYPKVDPGVPVDGVLPHGKGMLPGLMWCPACQKAIIGHTLHNPELGDPRRLCLHLTQRSCDVALGVPYNIASYALLLCLFSHLTGIRPGIFAHTLVDAHIYTSKPDGSKAEFDHVPGLQEQVKREPWPLPRLIIDPSIRELADIEALMAPSVTTAEILQKFRLEGYEPHPAIPFKVAV